MPIEYIEGSIENVQQIYECGRRAFAKDLMNKAMLSVADDDVEGQRELEEFGMQRLAIRLQKPGCHIFIAIDKEIENGTRLLGRAVWYEEPVFPSAKEEKKHEDKSEVPKSVNLALVKRIEGMAGEVREEYLKGMEGDFWCE
jgi:hypothetical protein